MSFFMCRALTCLKSCCTFEANMLESLSMAHATCMPCCAVLHDGRVLAISTYIRESIENSGLLLE